MGSKEIIADIKNVKLQEGKYFLDDYRVSIMYLNDPEVKKAIEERNKKINEHNARVTGQK